MSPAEFVKKWGIMTPSLIITKLANYAPADAQGAAQFHLVLELRDDLQSMLTQVAEHQRIK